MRHLALILLFPASAQAAGIECVPVRAEKIAPADFERAVKPLTDGTGLEVPTEKRPAGVSWDLGDSRTARLNVYWTKTCDLGLTTGLTFDSSSPNPDAALADFAKELAGTVLDWRTTLPTPRSLQLAREGVVYRTDVDALVKARLAAATPLTLNGAKVRSFYDGWSLFIATDDAGTAVNLSVVSTVYPWAYYDLRPWGLARLAVRFDGDKAVLWSLP
jgi:hypothetical protein